MSVRLVQIINQTKSEGAFTNLETSADDVIINANGSTNTPGQRGEGCNIPDCGAGKWWDSHRMTLTLENTVLSLWKEGHTVYYRSDQTVYPGLGCGNFLWQDNGLPATLIISPDSLPIMKNP